MHLVLTIRRFNGGQHLVTYLRTVDGRHCVCTTPVGFWRPRKRREVGGIPWRPFRVGHANVKALRELRRASLEEQP
jgi:hypothetical protein